MSIAFFIVMLAGCNNWKQASPTSSTPAPPSMTAFTPAIYLADDPGKFAAGAKQMDGFNFANLDDLWVRVTVPAMQGLSTLHLTFVNPKGEQMFEDHMPFSTDPTQKKTMMAIGESSVLTGVAVPGGFALDRKIPILGTVFTRYPPEGTWQVSASVDGFMTKLSVPMHVMMIR
jgi:hypothetical protein